jgi:hypothetical protein
MAFQSSFCVFRRSNWHILRFLANTLSDDSMLISCSMGSSECATIDWNSMDK